MLKLDRIYHHVDLWEEIKFNMWGNVDDKKSAIETAIEFTGDHNAYGHYMEKVINDWKYSCENALTDATLNKKAWIGHAACAMALDLPEDIIRKAWGYLTDEQRLLANRRAAKAIRDWQENHCKSTGISYHVGQQVLF